jgi:hypothetical protein
MIENITYNEEIYAVIIRSHYKADGVKFFTPNSFSQQLGYMHHPKNYEIDPHFHNPVLRTVELTKEVLFLKSGSVQVDFYSDNQKLLESRILFSGDVILLAHGGHGFKMLEDSELIEVKQGPYTGELDKTRFKSK